MKELTKAEEQIMQVLWKKGKGIVRELIEELPEPKPAYNTIATFLKILEKKGFVSRKAIANTYEYFPLVKKSIYTEQFMKNFMGKYFDGSVKQMMSFFIEKNDIGLEEYEELQQLLSKKTTKKS